MNNFERWSVKKTAGDNTVKNTSVTDRQTTYKHKYFKQILDISVFPSSLIFISGGYS